MAWCYYVIVLKLSCNRKKLLHARAPTVLLTLLLDVLKILEVSSSISSGAEEIKSNPTSDILQELIESLTSDISATDTGDGEDEGYESDLAHDASSMPLLLKSIETISLSPPLRSIIAKLLPFLTYGQIDLSRELAHHFDTHIIIESLSDCEKAEGEKTKSAILMATFVSTAINLPTNDVCNTLRDELIHIGFIEHDWPHSL